MLEAIDAPGVGERTVQTFRAEAITTDDPSPAAQFLAMVGREVSSSGASS